RIHRHADRLLSPDDMEFDNAEAIVFGSVAMCASPSSDAVLTAIRMTGERSIPLVFDVNVRPGLMPLEDLRMLIMAGLTASTVVKMSVDDAHHMWGVNSLEDAIDVLDRIDPPIAVITDGSRGALLRVGDQRIRQDVFAVHAIEPTGAG